MCAVFREKIGYSCCVGVNFAGNRKLCLIINPPEFGDSCRSRSTRICAIVIIEKACWGWREWHINHLRAPKGLKHFAAVSRSISLIDAEHLSELLYCVLLAL